MRIGLDTVEVSGLWLVARSMRRLFERVFGGQEREEWMLRRFAPQSAAAAFAAKEAFSKALGTGIRGFSLTEVQLVAR